MVFVLAVGWFSGSGSKIFIRRLVRRNFGVTCHFARPRMVGQELNRWGKPQVVTVLTGMRTLKLRDLARDLIDHFEFLWV